ncbi:MAG: response regulator [PVC group bacterium]|nr:response regulator [PVC group bacterium]
MAKKILLIEDNPDYIMITRRILEQAGKEYEVDSALEAQEGIRRVIEENYNLILCDYRLPGYSGLDVLKEIRKQGKDSPFVMVTSAGNEKIAVDVLQEGASDYVVKDSSYENILPMVIQKAIDRYDAKKEKEWLEKALIESNEKLKEMYAVKSDFTSMVSHELRTPLTAIREGITIVLDGSLGEINNDQKEFLDVAKRNVDRLKRLIDDVLDFSKLESKRMIFEIRQDDINTLIDEVVATQASVAQRKGLYLNKELAADLPKVGFDRDKVNQVLSNLISNAIKFTESGGIVVSSRSNEQENKVIISVTDTGQGIEKEDIPKLFQKYQQLGGVNQRKTGGTGLGLAISKQIIEQLGGKIWVDTIPGEGAKFHISLLLKRQYKILVIDDEEIVLDVCEKFLTREQYITFRASEGAVGIKLANDVLPDVIVLDMKLKDMGGYEIIGRLKSGKDTAHIPILVISGYEDEIARIKAQPEDIALPYLLKPLDREQFIAQIKTLLSG